MPLYYVPFHKLYNQKYWLIAFFVSFVIAQSSVLLNLVADFFSGISSQISIFQNYNRYLESSYYEVRENEGSGFVYLFRVMVSFFIIVLSKPIIMKHPTSKVYFV